VCSKDENDARSAELRQREEPIPTVQQRAVQPEGMRARKAMQTAGARRNVVQAVRRGERKRRWRRRREDPDSGAAGTAARKTRRRCANAGAVIMIHYLTKRSTEIRRENRKTSRRDENAQNRHGWESIQTNQRSVRTGKNVIGR